MFKEDQKFLEDTTVVSKLQHAKRLAEINQAEYDAIFYVGGHGPVLDLAVDRSNMALASAVCPPRLYSLCELTFP